LGYFRTGKLRAIGRVIGCAAAYALLINLSLTGLLGAQNAQAEIHGDPAFELCLTGDNLAPAGDGNAGHAAKIHCVLCVTGGQLAAMPAPATAAIVEQAVTPAPQPPVYDRIAPVSVDHRSTSPRGPPAQA
jgi:hypothetical protein